ncbi:MAG: 23S rRNA (adenine(2503)-C(2))-methyltransferase RlmN, partial [Clostridia bacterium]
MKILLDYNKTELQQVLAEYNFPSFVAGQVYSWINKGCDFVEMSNISKVAREKLSVEFVSVACRIEKTYTSAIDGTIKLLYRLHDGNLIEGVLMNYKYGNTLCVSTQVGCRMGCKFCASTLGGLVRNLSAGEILGQVVAVNRYLGGDL